MNGFSDQNVWGDSPLGDSPADKDASKPVSAFAAYGTADDDNIDDFKIQNELAATMANLRAHDDNYGGDDDAQDEEENPYNTGVSVVRPSSSVLGYDEVQMTDERSEEPLHAFGAGTSAGTGTAADSGLGPVTPSRVSASEMLALPQEEEETGFGSLGGLGGLGQDPVSAPAPGQSLFGNSTGPLGNFSAAPTNGSGGSTNGSTATTISSKPSRSSVSSPNRKVSLVRPRRAKVKKNLEAAKQQLKDGPQGQQKQQQQQQQQQQHNSSGIPPPVPPKSNADPLSQPVPKPEPPKMDIRQPQTVDEVLGTHRTATESGINGSPAGGDSKGQLSVQGTPTKSGRNSHVRSPQGATSPLPVAEPVPEAKLDITVGDPIKVGDLTNVHIVYTITTRTKSDILNAPETEVNRRYSDFLWLYVQLLQNHPGYIVPPPPEKQVYGRFDDKFIENRRLALETMLNKLAEKTVYQHDPDFIMFLQSSDFAEEAIKRERPPPEAAVAAATSDAGGFFSSLIGLNTPKYVESDQYILEKQVYVENLDSQLRSLSKSLDFILEKREEIVVTEQEIVTLVGALADVEVNSTVSELLSDFEELQRKVAQCLERTNMSQILTLGATVDEYIRVVGSIRNCFENRFKLCNALMTSEQLQAKKQKQVAKARAHGQPDKVQKYERELKRLDDTVATQTKLLDEYNTTFKRELALFDGEKVKEFKQIVEIYWEGLIESQKELIELWESFYDQTIEGNGDRSDTPKRARQREAEPDPDEPRIDANALVP